MQTKNKKKTNSFEYALYYLHLVPKTFKDMEAKLYQKGFSTLEVTGTMHQLVKNNLINDERFAMLYLQSEAGRKGKPIFLVQQKLLQKGVDKEIITKVVNELKTDLDQGVIVKIQKEIKKMQAKGLDGFSISKKLYSKGYDIDNIKKAVLSLQKD